MIAWRVGFAMLALGVGLLSAGAQLGGIWWLLAWPAAAFALVANAYFALGPRVLGKRADGTIPPWRVLPLFPYFALAWGVWHLKRVLELENPWDEVAPGLFLGRRVYGPELPTGTGLVVDLTAEFVEPAEVRAAGRYRCLATLDGAAPPDPAAFVALVREVAAFEGKAYVHCALGHGRSAAVMAGAFIARGLAAGIDEAERALQAKRPTVRLSDAQRHLLGRVVAELRPPAGPAAAPPT
ncbi:MAG TPA: hypothetical protein VHF22_08680 [Planctomycetota bacterium]|nr:hypothetical protein [Planctomycetota bacterium]